MIPIRQKDIKIGMTIKGIWKTPNTDIPPVSGKIISTGKTIRFKEYTHEVANYSEDYRNFYLCFDTKLGKILYA